MANREVKVAIIGDASKLRREMDQTEGRFAKFGSNISTGVAAASAALVAGIGIAIKGAWQAAEESAKIGRETERVIRTTGAAAWTSADQVASLAERISGLTGADDELVQSGANLLLTFTRIKNSVGSGNDVFDRATAAALDMSTALGTDMNRASIQLGKALNDPVRGITALTRSGVSFTAEQKNMIKSLVDTGDVLGAQKLILEELEKEFGGAAAAAATPLDHLKVTLGNLQESLGSALIPVVASAADHIGTLVDGFSALPEPVKLVAAGVAAVGVGTVGTVAVIAKLADVFGDLIGPAVRLGKGVLDDVALGAANMAAKMGASQDGALKLASGITGVGHAIPIVGAAALAGVAVWTLWSASQQEAKKRAEEFIATLDAQTGALTANTTEAVRAKLEDNNRIDNLNKAAVTVEQYTTAIGDNTSAMMSQEDVLARFNNGMKGAEEDNRRLAESLREQGGARNELIASLLEQGAADEGLIRQIYEETSAYDRNQQVLAERAVQQAIATGKTREQAEADINAAAAAEQNADAIKEVSDAMRAAIDPFFAASDAVRGLEEAQLAAFFAAQQYKAGSPELVAANEAVGRAALDTETAFLRLAEQMQRDGESFSTFEAATRRWVAAGWISEGQAKQLTDKFWSLARQAEETGSKNVDIPVAAPGLDTVIGRFYALRDSIEAAGRTAEVRGPGLVVGPPTIFTGRSAGGPVAPWSVYEMHDTTDPEVLRLASGKSLVFTGSEGGNVTNLGATGTLPDGAGNGFVLHIGALHLNGVQDARGLLQELTKLAKTGHPVPWN
jgi:hypothetical protein